MTETDNEKRLWKLRGRLSIGVPSFSLFATDKNLIYVDKSELFYRLITSDERFFFLSRPRTFGHSLTCRTLEEIFKGNSALFEGLAISKTDYDFTAYPVLYFDFSVLHSDFRDGLMDEIESQGRKYGAVFKEQTPEGMMDELICSLEEPVIIIDEYDNALIHAVCDNEKQRARALRAMFNAFYEVILKHKDKIRFLFITGVNRLSGLTIFDGIRDISFDPEYAALLGYTEEEVACCFSDYIDFYLEKEGREYETREELLSALKAHYGGYRFSPESEVSVYAPVSIGRFFSDSHNHMGMHNQWIDSGGLSTLPHAMASRNRLKRLEDRQIRISADYLKCFDLIDISEAGMEEEDLIAVLCYTGFLTTIGVDGTELIMDFVNHDAQDQFSNVLTRRYRQEYNTVLLEKVKSAWCGDTQEFLQSLESYLDAFHYRKGQDQLLKYRTDFFCHLM